jgi:hypothetical protein
MVHGGGKSLDPITGVFDFYTVDPRDMDAVVEAYLEDMNRIRLKSQRVETRFRLRRPPCARERLPRCLCLPSRPDLPPSNIGLPCCLIHSSHVRLECPAVAEACPRMNRSALGGITCPLRFTSDWS